MCALLAVSLCPLAASAQGFRSTSQSSRDGLSDGSSFYMSRRQYQVVDDSPIVKYSGGGQPAPSGGFGGAGAPLPRAGFQSYSSSINQNYVPPQNLPKVNNGVPPKPPTPPPVAAPKGPKSNKAKAGKLSSGKPATAQVPTAQGTHAYDSYKGYNPAASLPYGTAPAGSEAGAGQSSATNVKGSVLHWSRRRRGQ